jgi:Flp pilus assembly pilin Flp
MSNFMTVFLHNESGAVSVDWVVLTAVVVSLGIAAAAAARTGIVSISGKIETGVTVVGVSGENGDSE